MSAQDDESDWSDSSAGSVASSFSTTVMLGLPDGPIDTPTDLADAQVSRLGGPPSFLPTLRSFPPTSTTACKTCGRPSELLVQLYAPLEGSVDDRVVYVFGCARAGCQGEAGGSKKGSVRAFSSIMRNDKYASAHERRAAKKAAKAAAAATARASATPAPSATASFNPFAASAAPAAAAAFNPFAAAPPAAAAAPANLFAAANPFAPAPPAPAAAAVEDLSTRTAKFALEKESAPADGSDDDSDDDDESGPVATPDPAWSTVPSYPAQYLSTQTEFLTRPKLSKKQKAEQDAHLAEVAGMDEASRKKALEDFDQEYVKGSGIPGADETFERFLNRLQDEPSQVVRYDFGGNPLPYSSTSKLHATLFGSTPKPGTFNPVTASAPAGAASAAKRGVYDPARVPKCERCAGPRVFEMQLVPGLLNLLRVEQVAMPGAETAAAKGQAGEDERKRELEALLSAKRKAEDKTGMEWGTVDMFSCEAGCGGDWAEEWVGVEWEE